MISARSSSAIVSHLSHGATPHPMNQHVRVATAAVAQRSVSTCNATLKMSFFSRMSSHLSDSSRCFSRSLRTCALPKSASLSEEMHSRRAMTESATPRKKRRYDIRFRFRV